MLFYPPLRNEFMFRHQTTAGCAALYQTAVEVEVWGGFFLKKKSGIAKTLYTYSLNNGPLYETADDKLILRFTLYDWQKNIEQLLSKNNIHFIVVGTVGVDPLRHLLRKKIFVADDDPDITLSLSTILEDAGYQVNASSRGQAILDGNYAWIDLFILDNKMPDVDGIQLCRHLRSQSVTKETPVIMISAAPQRDNEALLAGANAYIEKPFHVHYLLNVVSKYTRDVNRQSR